MSIQNTARPSGDQAAPVDPAAEARVRSHRRRRSWLFAIAAIAVIAIPLAANALFSGAFSNVADNLGRVPAAVVNNDKLITTTAADGTQSTVYAGRGLVTELTGPNQTGFDWNVTNSDDAAKGLADGTYYAVLTIPENFSAQINTLGTPAPAQGSVSIVTDDAHGYLSGVVASTVGTALKAGFGETITAQVLTGVYSGLGTVGTQLSTAANGAGQLASGASGLTDGLNQLATGASSAASGAGSLSSGIDTYTGGVDSLADGVSTLDSQAGSLSRLSGAVSDYTDGVSTLAGGFSQLQSGFVAAVNSNPNLPDATKQQLLGSYAQLSGGLNQAAAGGSTLSSQTASGLDALQGGIAQLSSGASQLSGGSAQLRSGASDLSGGLTTLASGVQQSAAGAAQLTSGATTLQSGLQTGADALTKSAATDPAASAAVAANPIAVDVSTQNSAGGIGSVIAVLVVPAGLWFGALAIFLFLRPIRASLLASSTPTGRLAVRLFGRASVFAALQAIVVIAYLQFSLNPAWSSLPALLGFGLLVALAFTAFHQFLTAAFGRVGAVISLILFAVQIATTAGIYPVEILAGPFQFINAISPLAYAVSGIQGILTGGAAGPVWTSVGVLAVLLLLSLVFATAALARRRRPERTGWLLVGAPERSTGVRRAAAVAAVSAPVASASAGGASVSAVAAPSGA
ncbi:YhgE/Pip domain-containing protein [Subtercola sp. Z020]|uniref:YhgE/Pip family protein n=1 Tax=Subtercola sp. Z020 TaxID=2080582 RepID=UPI000CE77A4D|nr:YhgE/Pip family protein [Subtercola sp. Z020]PPF89212.1 YhgE/Pip domain-containing protein [Subtercola sp. Z020]